MVIHDTPGSFRRFASRMGRLALATAACGFALAPCQEARSARDINAAGIRGALVICGGGKVPEAARERFVSLADGGDARLVIVPSGSDDEDVEADGQALLNLWRARGPAEAVLLHTRSRDVANDPQFVAPLRKATGVWFSGGKQSVLARTYVGTAVERELRGVLERGGVVGGTSAGAAIMSGPLIVRGKLFESPGFGLLPGAIIDQHFMARDRKPRLLEALVQHPRLFGVGVDEGTALIVEGQRLEAIGESTVTICPSVLADRPRREIVLKHGETAEFSKLRLEAQPRHSPRSCP